jgi:hypothetical protein
MPAAVPIMIGLAAGGTAISAIGQIKGGNAAKSQGDFNAAVAEQQAQDALARGTQDEERFRQGVRTLIGSQRASFAGQGVDVGTGSAADVQADAAYLGELDANTIRQNAARTAAGFKVQAENYRMGGSNAQTAGYFGAASTVLGTAGSLLAAKYGWGANGGNKLPSTPSVPGFSSYMPG